LLVTGKQLDGYGGPVSRFGERRGFFISRFGEEGDGTMRTHRVWLGAVGVLIAGVAFLGLGRPQAAAQANKSGAQEDKASIWMRGKLTNSKNIVEGLTREDFKLVRENAETMQFMGYLEQWFRSDVEGYKGQVQAFQYANAALVKAAREKNLDGATLAYTQLTISCVQCHKIVRGATR
jgi:hypothetical protein